MKATTRWPVAVWVGKETYLTHLEFGFVFFLWGFHLDLPFTQKQWQINVYRNARGGD